MNLKNLRRAICPEVRSSHITEDGNWEHSFDVSRSLSSVHIDGNRHVPPPVDKVGLKLWIDAIRKAEPMGLLDLYPDHQRDTARNESGYFKSMAEAASQKKTVDHVELVGLLPYFQKRGVRVSSGLDVIDTRTPKEKASDIAAKLAVCCGIIGLNYQLASLLVNIEFQQDVLHPLFLTINETVTVENILQVLEDVLDKGQEYVLSQLPT